VGSPASFVVETVWVTVLITVEVVKEVEVAWLSLTGAEPTDAVAVASAAVTGQIVV
jgi:hypothetical protein